LWLCWTFQTTRRRPDRRLVSSSSERFMLPARRRPVNIFPRIDSLGQIVA